ncbi:MAG TPA: tetratricopeptide repeat protein [Phormidium sp.]
MGLTKFGIAAFIGLLTVITDSSVNFHSLTSLPVPKVLAQTNTEKDKKAFQLFYQGLQKSKIDQFREALQFWEQSLAIYREIGNREREGTLLVLLSFTYAKVGDHQKALDSAQQGLAVARELKDPKLEQLAQEALSKVQEHNNSGKSEAD